MDSVLVAGGRVEPPLSEIAGQTIKGLFRLNSTPCIRQVVEALFAAGLKRIALVGSELLLQELPAGDERLLYTSEGADVVENLLRGVRLLELSERDLFLQCAADLPFLTAQSVSDFLDRCPQEADLYVPFVPVERFEARFPNCPYQAIRFQEGRFLNGSLLVIRAGLLFQYQPFFKQFALARKSQWRVILMLSRLLGLSNLLRCLPALLAFLQGRLAIQRLRRLMEQLFDLHVEIDLSGAPEFAFDLDTVEDYRYALEWKRGRE